MKFTESYEEDIRRVCECIPQIRAIYGHSVLLTGVTGMIVSAVADVLLYLNKSQNARIGLFFAGRDLLRVKERFPEFKEGKDFQYLFFDATLPDTLAVNVDYVINGASAADPVSFVERPVETMLASIVGVNALLSMARKSGVKRFLQISSSEVYGKKDSVGPYTETEYGFVDIMNPRACYPSAKRAADTLCVAYSQEYDVDVVIARPGHIYGPSITRTDSRASSQFTRMAAAGQDIVMKSAGLQLRSYCHTLDCASAILTILLNGERGQAYNISNKASVVSIREMAEAFAKAGNVKVVFELPSDMEVKGYNMMSNSSLDASRLETLGWRALFGMEEGARRTLMEY